MNTTKKLLAMLLAISVCAPFCACGIVTDFCVIAKGEALWQSVIPRQRRTDCHVAALRAAPRNDVVVVGS